MTEIRDFSKIDFEYYVIITLKCRNLNQMV